MMFKTDVFIKLPTLLQKVCYMYLTQRICNNTAYCNVYLIKDIDFLSKHLIFEQIYWSLYFIHGFLCKWQFKEIIVLRLLRQIRFLTVHFHFTEVSVGFIRIPLGIRRMSSIVVVDDVSPMVRTGDVDRIRYRGSGVDSVPKTQHSVLFVCCVGDVEGEPQKVSS